MARLTTSEMVWELIRSGMLGTQIARLVDVSPSTIDDIKMRVSKTHMHSIHEKIELLYETHKEAGLLHGEWKKRKL